jgi:hypothetical protein
VGGEYFGDSSRIDMLWVPLRPKASGQPGHERGNPHIDVDTILAIWRDSVPETTRHKWLIVDPAEKDRVPVSSVTASLVPLQNPDAVQAAASPAEPPAAVGAATHAATEVPSAAPVPADENSAVLPAGRAVGGTTTEAPDAG